VSGTEAVSFGATVAAKDRKNVLIVLEDGKATAVRLADDERAEGALPTPSIVTFITGPNKARTSLCIGLPDACTSPDAISLELPASEVSASIAMPVRALLAPRQANTGGLRVTEAPAALGTAPVTFYAPPDLGTRPVASILIVASQAVVMEGPDALTGKIIVTLDGKKKDYVGHVTLNR
jgi:hypothetical protein